MGILDEPTVAPVASEVRTQLFGAASTQELFFTPFAGELLVTFITSAMFEPALPPTWPPPPKPDVGQDLFNQLIEAIPGVLADLRETSGVVERDDPVRGVLTTADVYHWLSDRAALQLRLRCPYEK
jgi:hypothetical protein